MIFRQQINNMMAKCRDILDAMYSPAPMDSEDDLSSFSSRSDDLDIQFVDTNSTETDPMQVSHKNLKLVLRT